ncbi:MAG: alpha-L-fucosidase [Prevotella sp.]|nr:alpha-L-fucosidase [Prevotella sp.]
MYLKAFLSLAILASIMTIHAQRYEPSKENLQARKEFQDARFGIFIHWGVYSMLGDGEWVQHNKRINRDEYALLPGGFYPSRFNANEWVKAFKEAGAGYITFTSRHHDGFSMFKSQATDFNIVDATPFRRDIIKELSEACAKEGLKLNLYYSHLDWHRTDYPLGSSSKTLPHDESLTNWTSYYRFMNTQLTELLTNYGPIGAIWFDGEWDHKTDFDWQLDEQYTLIHRLQPACLIGNNHHHAVRDGEDIQIFEQDLPGENTAGFSSGQDVSQKNPLETCLTMNHTWGYSITDKSYKTVNEIIQKLVRSAGMNANLLLNIGPQPDGQLPTEALDLLKGIGEWTQKYGETIFGTRGGCIEPQLWGVTTQRGNTLYVHILDPETTEITLPIHGKSLRRAVFFDNKEQVEVKKGKYSSTLTIKKPAVDTADRIIEISLKPRK